MKETESKQVLDSSHLGTLEKLLSDMNMEASHLLFRMVKLSK